MPGSGTNPLEAFGDSELQAIHLAITLLCLRAKSATNKKHAVRGCALQDPLADELERRGLPKLGPPWRG